jgi:uncharacterized OB-fold protein
MMTTQIEEVECLTLKGQIAVPYNWSVGEVGSRFLTALRDEKKILGNRCEGCGTVYVPPRKNCGRCFKDIGNETWVELSNEGVVTAYTIVRFHYPLQAAQPPFAYALIKIDGADVGLVHIIKENLDVLKNGVRVRALFREERIGHILDIDSFELI